MFPTTAPAATDAVEYLTSLGHKRIGLVAGLMTLESGINRLEGYKDGLLSAGLNFDQTLVANGDYRKDKAFEATRRLITMEMPPTALLVCNELMTGATLECLKLHNVAIPEQISLIGFDDPAWGELLSAIDHHPARRAVQYGAACQQGSCRRH